MSTSHPRLPGLRARHVDLVGTRLYCRSVGHGPALLLLHGWALDGRLWTPQVRALMRHHRVVVVDRPGFGRSSGQPGLAREVAALRILCRRLGLIRPAVVGMSQATRVALRLAQCRSLGVRALVLEGPPPPRGADDRGVEDPPMTRYRALVAAQGLNAFRALWRQHPLATLRKAGREARHLLQRMLRRYPGLDLTRPVQHATRSPSRAVVPEAIPVPTLVVCGCDDLPHRRAAAAALAARLPRATAIAIEAAGHMPGLDSPRAYTKALAAFLRRHPGPASRG